MRRPRQLWIHTGEQATAGSSKGTLQVHSFELVGSSTFETVAGSLPPRSLAWRLLGLR